MSDSIYRGRGLHKGVSAQTTQKLIARYLKAKSRRARQGFFLGIDFLRDLTGAIEADPGLDGLYVQFGLSAGADDTPAKLELIATPVELGGGDAFTIKREGVHYCSIGDGSTSPPALPSPPLGGSSS